MRGYFCAVVLLGWDFCMAHPKSGFFLEGGFMTGMLDSVENIREKPSCGFSVICPKEFMLNASPTITQAILLDKKNPLTFSTTQPVKMRLKNGQLYIESFLPYDLHNVDIYMKTVNGQKVKVGMIKDLPKFTKTYVGEDLLPEIAKAGGNANSSFGLNFSNSSDPITKQVLTNLNNITVNIQGKITQGGAEGNTSWAIPTPKNAEELIEIFLNLAAMLSSPQFKKAVLNAPFPFVDGPGDYNPNVVPNAQGQCDPNSACNQYILDKQQVYDKYTSSKTLVVDTLTPKGPQGLGGPGVFGIQPYLIDPKNAKILTNYNIGSGEWPVIWPIITVMHEFGHVNGYDHNGNMTYQNGWFGSPAQKDPSGPHSEWGWDRFAPGTQPSGASGLHFVKNSNGTYFLNGMGGIGVDVWTTLGRAGKLPIDYNQLSAVPSPIYNSSFIQALSHSLPSEGVSTDAMVGFNLKSGYQQYFNNVVGLSYYGIAKYNFSKRLGYIKKISQVGLGAGMDILIDFKTTYKTHYTYLKKKKKRVKISKKTFQSAFGIFGGVRALWDMYFLETSFFNAWNLEAVAGFNYRYKHSKYSIGTSLPLLQKPLHFAINTKNLMGSMTLYDGVRHFNVFFNYGWVF